MINIANKIVIFSFLIY